MKLAIQSKSILALLIATATWASSEGMAHAQQVTDQPVSPTAKGIIGGALLGGEVVMMTEALIGVRPVWPYLVGGGLGAVGGGVAGYFIESSSTDGRVPVFMLAGGLALVIPTMVLTLNATRYRSPAEENMESQAPVNTNEPKADPGKPGSGPVQGGESKPAAAPAPAPAPATPGGGGGAPLSLVNVRGGTLSMSVPVPEVRPVYSAVERVKYNLRNETEFRLPVVNVVF